MARLPSLRSVLVFGTPVVMLGVALGDVVGSYRISALILGFLAVLAAIAYLIWQLDPAYTICAAVLLSPFGSNWQQLGVPGFVSPNRLLLAAGIAVVMLRAPGCNDRPRLRFGAVHWVMAAAIGYIAVSAAAAGTLFERTGFFWLLEIVGVLPFLLFLVAPVAFRTPHQRRLLLATLVLLGAYLSLTAFFETVGPKALVWPRYILDPTYGGHYDRARGPFVEAVTFGAGMFTCALGAAVAFRTWRHRLARTAAAAVVVFSLLGIFFTVTRSVWIGTVVGAVVLLLTPPFRRYLPVVLIVGAVAISGALVLIPGLASKTQSRESNHQTVWDRQNLNAAALNMVDVRPLFGFGWHTFTAKSSDYFQLSADYPMLQGGPTIVHNLWLGYLSELGLVGTGLIVLALALGVGGAVMLRGPPELELWRYGLFALIVFYAVVSNSVFPQVFPNLALWLWAGVVWAARDPELAGAFAPVLRAAAITRPAS